MRLLHFSDSNNGRRDGEAKGLIGQIVEKHNAASTSGIMFFYIACGLSI